MVPVFSTDALSKLSMGEVVIKRQRMNPSNPRLRSFNRYCFKLPVTPDLPERKLPETPIFNMKEEYEKKKPKREEKLTVENLNNRSKEEKNQMVHNQQEEIAEEIKGGDELGINER